MKYITKCYIIENCITGYRVRDMVHYGELPVSYVEYNPLTDELTVDIAECAVSALEEVLAPLI